MAEVKSDLNKQEQVFELVKAGVSTRKEIIEKVGCTSGAFASYLSSMRMAAKFSGQPICPMEKDITEQVDGKDVAKKVFVLVSFEEAEKAKEERAASSKVLAKTPEERKVLAEKRVEKAAAAVEKTKTAFEANQSSEEHDLRHQAAKIEHRLAEIALANIDVVGADVAEAEEVEATGDVNENEELL